MGSYFPQSPPAQPLQAFGYRTSHILIIHPSIQIRKKEINLSLLTDYMIIYVENSKESIYTHKLLELISEFSNVISIYWQ